MVRSYAVTFTFVLTRVFKPFHFWTHLGAIKTSAAIILLTVGSLLLCQIAFQWPQLKTRRT